MDRPRFDPEALNLLAGAVYDPQATRFYEALSDSFHWSDELVWEAQVLSGASVPDLRKLMTYRSSVIRGEPETELRPWWELVAKACPGWPGLRPERSSPTLAAELHRAGRKICTEFLRTERERNRLNEQAPDA